MRSLTALTRAIGALAFYMNEDPTNHPPKQAPAKTGVTLFFLVGGFLLIIMIIGWLIIGMR